MPETDPQPERLDETSSSVARADWAAVELPTRYQVEQEIGRGGMGCAPAM
jgi:hypothetical protein